MSYIGTTKIGKMFLGEVEIGKAYLGNDLVFQKGGTPTPTPNYLVFGNPSIQNGILHPDINSRSFIYTNEAFNPDTSGWTIQTKIRINTAIANKVFIASVDADGAFQYSIFVMTDSGSSNTAFKLYLSSNGTSWNLLSGGSEGTMSAGVWRVFQIVCTRSGSNYVYKMGFPELSAWTNAVSKTSHPIYGKRISFGGGANSYGLDADLDLAETKIWIGDTLWWEALTQ